jgi:ABC-2 type transport system permease protein
MKFSSLFKKEFGGLMTKQVIFSMLFSMILFIFLGQMLGGAMEDVTSSAAASGINIANLDDSAFTADVLARVKEQGYANLKSVTVPADTTPENYPALLDDLNIENLIIIPQGYGNSATAEKKKGSVIFVSKMKTGGLFSSMESVASSDVINSLDKAASDTLMHETYGLSDSDIEFLDSSTTTVDYTTYKGKVAEVPAATLGMYIMMQNMAAPLVVFFLLMMASQMIMTAISTEKIDKTLETLLSTPISRMSVLMSKMVAAVVAALINALTLCIGMVFYIGGMLGGAVSGAATGVPELASMAPADQTNAIVNAVSNVPEALGTLGLTMSPLDFVLFVLQLILTVAIGLGISLILGAMATDIKSLGTLMMPIMIMTMLPFFICMFADVNTMPMPIRVVMYLIPFTHAYMAIPNLIAGQTMIFWLGFIYQVLFFGGTMYAAVRMFMSDRLFTVSFGDAANQNNPKKPAGLFGGLKK